MDGFDAALARYRAFLAHDPITPLLRRSLALLVPGNIRVDTVTADDSLRCTTDGAAVIVGGAAYLLRADFDARHWTAALRVLLAREIQHDSSSDRDVCAAFAVDAGAYFHAHHALAPETGALLGLQYQRRGYRNRCPHPQSIPRSDPGHNKNYYCTAYLFGYGCRSYYRLR